MKLESVKRRIREELAVMKDIRTAGDSMYLDGYIAGLEFAHILLNELGI